MKKKIDIQIPARVKFAGICLIIQSSLYFIMFVILLFTQPNSLFNTAYQTENIFLNYLLPYAIVIIILCLFLVLGIFILKLHQWARVISGLLGILGFLYSVTGTIGMIITYPKGGYENMTIPIGLILSILWIIFTWSIFSSKTTKVFIQAKELRKGISVRTPKPSPVPVKKIEPSKREKEHFTPVPVILNIPQKTLATGELSGTVLADRYRVGVVASITGILALSARIASFFKKYEFGVSQEVS